MENIRNYKTNSKTKFVDFCHCQNKDEQNTNNKKPDKQWNEVQPQEILIGIFIDGCWDYVNDNCKKPKEIAGCPAYLFLGWQHQNQNQNKKCENENTEP